MKRTTPKMQQQIAKPTNAERLANYLEELRHRITRDIDSGKASVAKLSEEMSHGSYRAIDRFEWLDGPAKDIAKAALAEKALAIHEDKKCEKPISLHKACTYVLRDCRESLLGDRYRGGSTSSFHNATDDAKRAAASYWCDSMWSYESLCTRLEKLKAVVTAEEALKS
jgi:hypothetical protein